MKQFNRQGEKETARGKHLDHFYERGYEYVITCRLETSTRRARMSA